MPQPKKIISSGRMKAVFECFAYFLRLTMCRDFERPVYSVAQKISIYAAYL
jgi:hypothetical protein